MRSNFVFLSLMLTLIGCSSELEQPNSIDPPNSPTTLSAGLYPEQPNQEDFPHLPNLLRVSNLIYCGAQPEGEKGFQELANLGVKTVVSVDGAIPQVELAKASALRYCHIPIGYDGISETASNMFTALVRSEQGPFYIHCHHGKHRGPAAAAVVCIASGHIDGEAARKILEQAGTSRKYGGLWKSVEAYAPPPLDAQLPKLVEVAKLDSLAATMANIDQQYDRLKLCQAAGWQPPTSHPDVSPAQEALLLKESFRELCRSLDENQTSKFRTWMKESEELANKLQADLSAEVRSVPADLDKTFQAIESQCERCHVTFRN